MPFKWVVLSTDLLLYVLLLALLIFVFWVRRHEDLRRPWRQVARRKFAMIAAVVFSCFVFIGMLDSVHLRFAQGKNYYSSEVYSLLDLIMSPIGERYEQSFSAPFATHSYSKSMVQMPSGKMQMMYKPLMYGGAHLAPGESATVDILFSAARAIVIAILLWLIFSSVIVTWQAKRLGMPFKERWRNLVWHEVLLTTLFVFIITSLVVALAANYHILGTDKVGKDVFFEAVKSIRTGLVIGTVTTLVMLPFAVFLGTIAGFFGGWVDDIIQYVYTTLSSIPGVLLISAAVLTLQIYITNHPTLFPTITQQADARLLALCLILGVTSWTGLCRLLRAETLKVREMDYVRMATALGVKRFKIILAHVLPNVLHIVLITVVLDFSSLVLAEAVLSYVGVGVDPTTFSWGNMINSARLDLAREPVVWWPLFAAFIFMLTLVLAANLFADAVRDAFDPRLREIE